MRAQQNVPLGGRCSAFGANAECSQAGTPPGGVPVICSDNGVSRDGAFNCCRNAGGVCSADFHCCGAAFCVNGVCGGGGTSGLPLGAECTSTTQCSQSGGSVVCADNGLLRDGARNCCRNTGGACTSDFQCCADLLCANGVCGGGSTSGGTLAPGASCTATSQCSQAGGAVVCADNGIATDGSLNCCRNAGGACTTGAGCCGGLQCLNGVCGGGSSSGGTLAPGAQCTSTSQCSQAGGSVTCADNGYADDGALNCCRNAGGACTDTVRSADCCGGLYCRNGVCTDLSVTGDLPPGSACSSADQCSQVGGAVVCADNGIATDGSLNCCRNAGGACTTGAGCCGGLQCLNGVCGGGSSSGGTLAPGAQCTSTSQCSQAGGSVTCADNGIASDGALNCCRYEGGSCTTGAGCCAALECVGGVCTSGGSTGGNLALGASCTASSQCSQAGGTVLCADNGITTDGALNCCRNAGGACTAANNSASCCGGLLCVNGVCQ